jgi:hypothetical protein
MWDREKTHRRMFYHFYSWPSQLITSKFIIQFQKNYLKRPHKMSIRSYDSLTLGVKKHKISVTQLKIFKIFSII